MRPSTVILQVVGKRVDVTLSHEWGERQPRTQLIAIGEHGAMNDEVLRQTFDRCQAHQLGQGMPTLFAPLS